jgi:hypothetical protein
MSDTADAQGDFSIQRVPDDGDDHPPGGPASGRAAAARDSVPRMSSEATLSEKAPRAKTHEDGFPDRVRRKYYVLVDERMREGATLKVYADERGEFLAFKATQDRLTTRLASTQVIHDMLAVAEHRAWRVVLLRGSVEFRREAWLEAGVRGIEPRGYQPTDLDRQAMAHRRAAREGANRHLPDSSGLSKANRLKRGDEFHSREIRDQARDTVTAADFVDGKPSTFRRQLSEGRFRAGAENLRAADRRKAERGEAFVAAQSQLAIIEKALERALPRDPQARERILAAARERVDRHLRQGRSFERAMISERAPANPQSMTDRIKAHRDPDEARERTRQRER